MLIICCWLVSCGKLEVVDNEKATESYYRDVDPVASYHDLLTFRSPRSSHDHQDQGRVVKPPRSCSSSESRHFQSYCTDVIVIWRGRGRSGTMAPGLILQNNIHSKHHEQHHCPTDHRHLSNSNQVSIHSLVTRGKHADSDSELWPRNACAFHDV